MQEERPSPDYICRSNYDGTGDWVLKKHNPKAAISKFTESILYKIHIWVTSAFWIPTYIRYRLGCNRRHSIPSLNYFSNLLFGIDHRKTIDFFCLLAPISWIYFFSLEHGVLYDLLLATSAAAIFDIFITILPREQRKRIFAAKVHAILNDLVELKNYQYEALGYLQNRSELMIEEWPSDIAMTMAKAEKLMKLMDEKANSALTGYRPNLPIELYQAGTIRDFFLLAHDYFIKQLQIIKNAADSDLFPRLHEAASTASDILNKRKILPQPFEAGEYASYHFRIIESLQLHYNIECYRYSCRAFDIRLIFNGESIKHLMRVGAWSYAKLYRMNTDSESVEKKGTALFNNPDH